MTTIDGKIWNFDLKTQRQNWILDSGDPFLFSRYSKPFVESNFEETEQKKTKNANDGLFVPIIDDANLIIYTSTEGYKVRIFAFLHY